MEWPQVATLVLVVLMGMWVKVGQAYANKKAENLATSEDVAEITKKVQGVELAFDRVRELFAQQNRLQLVAAERRIQAHQEAFAWWWQLILAGDSLATVSSQAQGWWVANCLYLHPSVRMRFQKLPMRLRDRGQLLHPDWPRSDSNRQIIEDTWKEVENLGRDIASCVELPGIGDSLTEEIGKLRAKDAQALAKT